MNHCLPREVLVEFFSDRLPSGERESVGEHLAQCALCQILADTITDDEEVRQFQRSHSQVPAEPSGMEPLVELRNGLFDFGLNRTNAGTSGRSEPKTTHPATLGRYHLQRRLGAGGFGVVYLAEDVQLHRPVALKLPRLPALSDPEGRGRFLREAKAAAGLHHPHIVAVYDAGECDGVCYLASAYCPGQTLAEWFKDRTSPATPDAAAQILLALAEAVEHAHENGVLHRDIKPQNVLLDPSVQFQGLPFTPKLTDFSIAKLVDGEGTATATEVLLGTPQYIAPELVAGRRDQLGPACDIYALGVVLYELLTGQAPIEGTSPADTLRLVLSDEPVPPRKLVPAVPRDLEAICLTCLEKTPKRRYASADLLAADLQRFLLRQATVARPIGFHEQFYRLVRRRPAAAGLIGVTLAASILFLIGLTLHSRQLGSVNLDLHQSNLNLENALSDAERAKTRAELSEDETQQLLYVSDMRLAGRAWKDGDLRELTHLLQRHIPQENEPDRRGLEWHFLSNQVKTDSRLVAQFDQDVYCLRAAPDGQRLAAAGKDAVVRIYDMTTGALLSCIATGQREVNGVGFSPDGQMLVSAGDDGTLCIWRIADGRQTLVAIDAHGDLAYDAVYTPDGRTLISCGNEEVIKLWDAETGAPLGALRGHRRKVDAIQVSPDGRLLASAGGDAAAKIWDLATQTELFTLRCEGEDKDVTALSFSHDGTRLVSAGSDETIRLWDVASGRQRAQGKHLDNIHSVGISTDGNLFASGDGAGVIQLWKLQDEAPESPGHLSDPADLLVPVRRWRAHEDRVYSLLFTPDGNRLITASADGTVRSWTLPSATGPRVLPANEDVRDLVYLPDSRTIAVAFADAIRLVDSQTGEVVREFGADRADWYCLDTDRAGKLLTACNRQWEFCLWDLSSGVMRQTWNLGRPTVGCLSPDGRMVAACAGGSQDAVQVFDAASGRQVNSLKVPLSALLAMSFSPDSKQLAITDNRTILVWDIAGAERQVIDHAHATSITSHAFSPDGSLLATASADRLVKLWNLATGSERATLSGHRSPVNSVAFSPDGRSLLTASEDGALKVWNVAVGEELFDLHHHPSGLARVRASSDERRLVCITAGDRSVLLFELAGTDGPDPAPKPSP